MLAATQAAAGPFGARWNWQREERAVRAMCETWVTKHPEIRADRDDGSSTKAKATGALQLYWDGEADAADSHTWLVRDLLLPDSGKGLVSGQSGLYKTFVLIDLAARVMAGGIFVNLPIDRCGGVLLTEPKAPTRSLSV